MSRDRVTVDSEEKNNKVHSSSFNPLYVFKAKCSSVQTLAESELQLTAKKIIIKCIYLALTRYMFPISHIYKLNNIEAKCSDISRDKEDSRQ